MAELKHGTIVELAGGGQVKVDKELGRGGQGIVYLCEFQGSKYALKWYTQHYSDVFYNNLKSNVEAGSPSKSNIFLWPLMLTNKQYDSFGYVMQLRPPDFKEFGNFLLAKTKYTTVSAMLNTAFQMCEGFYHLHLNGYSYQDLNDGNFFINPQTGDLLICDNDNVTAQGQNLGILGKMRYMAPEVVLGKLPDKYSDYFSLAVMLFRLFFKDHPLEGVRVLSVPCMTENGEKKYYGSEALFIYDKDNKENLPVRGVNVNVIKFWPLYPDILRNAFIDAFSQANLKNPTQRWMESKWEKTLIELRNRLVVNDAGQENFLDTNSAATWSIQTKSFGTIALSPQKKVFLGKAKEPIAVVRTNKQDPDTWALQNLGKDKWIVETGSGKLKEVNAGEVMPTKSNLKITFPGGEQGVIVN
ncbi:MAG: serine/threonine-protein kinase [Salinivirgaceae bacterium]|nr:serine/threonine-protein kinase [Salinivirgaceae bacterium]